MQDDTGTEIAFRPISDGGAMGKCRPNLLTLAGDPLQPFLEVVFLTISTIVLDRAP
jgi:hypothetical protein